MIPFRCFRLFRLALSFRYRSFSTSGFSSLPDFPEPQRIDILGLGNVGQFLAHSLSALPIGIRGPVVLHFRNINRLRAFHLHNDMITLTTDGNLSPQKVDSIEVSDSEEHSSKAPIRNLIVATKAPDVVPAISNIKHRLDSSSTILFFQNGMGVQEEVSSKVFSSAASQPQYLQGIITHGLHGKAGEFSVTHAGKGSIALGSIDITSSAILGVGTSYMEHIIQQCAVLNVSVHFPTNIMELKWEKLVVNAVVNPLTAIYNIPNGELLSQQWESRVNKLISEISAVIQALPDLEMSAKAKERFIITKLGASVRGVIAGTADNVSSMLQDVRARKRTEIDYITGYILRRADELGIRCPENQKLMTNLLALEELVKEEKQRD